MQRFLLRYVPRFPGLNGLLEQLGAYQEPEPLPGALMNRVEATAHKLCVLIDEYDSFANDLLASGQQSVYIDAMQTPLTSAWDPPQVKKKVLRWLSNQDGEPVT